MFRRKEKSSIIFYHLKYIYFSFKVNMVFIFSDLFQFDNESEIDFDS